MKAQLQPRRERLKPVRCKVRTAVRQRWTEAVTGGSVDDRYGSVETTVIKLIYIHIS